MKISEYILQEFRKRLESNKVLVVYDPEHRYADIFHQLEANDCQLVNAIESTIQARLEAERGLRELAKATPRFKHMAIYVPRKAPELTDNEARQLEPFAYFNSVGAVFPSGDGDTYKSLCRKAKPVHVVEIDRLFDHGSDPSFEVIDAIDSGGGLGWPRLRSLVKADSAQDMIIKFLAADDALRKQMDEDDAWVSEMRDFLSRSFGLSLITKGKKWRSTSDEIWRHMLFSEFAFDLPEALPDALIKVPMAFEGSKELVYEICDRLRNNRTTQHLYVDQAEQIADQLQIEKSVGNAIDFGDRDTFSFEERGFLQNYTEAVIRGDFDGARQIEETHRASIWVNEGERMQEWRLVGQAFQLAEAIEDFERENATQPKELLKIIDCYCSSLQRIDQLHRAMLQAEEDLMTPSEMIAQLVENVSDRYEQLISVYIQAFTTATKQAGWPPEQLPRNRDVFSRFVEPLLKAGDKVAYFLIDSLRYELAAELQQELEKLHLAQLHVVSAQLPTITPVGMASLMPQADQSFGMVELEEGFAPSLGGAPKKGVADRIEWIKSLYGDRFMDMKLGDLVRLKSSFKFAPVVDLIVIRNTEIDAAGETEASLALREIPRTLQKIRAAIQTLSDRGFSNIVIATDHGFHLRTTVRPGYKSEKPEGEWKMQKDRVLIGKGNTTEHTLGFVAEEVGIPLADKLYVVPKNMSTFIENRNYFHSGLSLQECVLPLIVIKTESAKDEAGDISIKVSYKDGRMDTITTRRPVIEISYLENMFGPEVLQLRLEAQSKEDVVGEAVIGKSVDAATGLVTIQKGAREKVPLKMVEDFQGVFEVVALNPDTLRSYDSIKLKTNYTL